MSFFYTPKDTTESPLPESKVEENTNPVDGPRPHHLGTWIPSGYVVIDGLVKLVLDDPNLPEGQLQMGAGRDGQIFQYDHTKGVLIG